MSAETYAAHLARIDWENRLSAARGDVMGIAAAIVEVAEPAGPLGEFCPMPAVKISVSILGKLRAALSAYEAVLGERVNLKPAALVATDDPEAAA